MMNTTMGAVYTETMERLCAGLSEFLRIRNQQMWELEATGSMKTLSYPGESDLELRLTRMAEARSKIRRCNALVQEQCAAVGALISFLEQFEEDDIFSAGDF